MICGNGTYLVEKEHASEHRKHLEVHISTMMESIQEILPLNFDTTSTFPNILINHNLYTKMGTPIKLENFGMCIELNGLCSIRS